MEEDRFLSVCKKIVADYTNKHIMCKSPLTMYM